MDREQRDQLTWLARQRALTTDHVHSCSTELSIHLDTGERLSSEEKQRPEQMVKPASRTTEDEDPPRLKPHCRRERELKIAGVLVHPMTLDMLDGGQRLRRYRVQIAHKQIDRPSQFRPAVGRDHRRVWWQSDEGGTIRPTGKNNNRLHIHKTAHTAGRTAVDKLL